jgi:hypothetical protein
VSPLQVEEAIRETFGGSGTQATTALDKSIRLLNEKWVVGGESTMDAVYRRFGLAFGGAKSRQNRTDTSPLPQPISDGAIRSKNAGHDSLSDMLFGSSADAQERVTKPVVASTRSEPPSNLPLPEPSSTITHNGEVVESGGDPIGKAKREMAKSGITSEQRSAYKPGVSEVLERGVYPYGASYMAEHGLARRLKAIPDNLINGRDAGRTPVSPQRSDAFRLYLGLPQQHGTFEVSDYRPTETVKGGEHPAYYFKLRDGFSPILKNKASEFESLSDEDVAQVEADTRTAGPLDDSSEAAAAIRLIVSDAKARGNRVTDTDPNDVMGNYALSVGRDSRGPYISYHDRWDLEYPINGKLIDTTAGRPFELYDRLYYDPKTFEPKFTDAKK